MFVSRSRAWRWPLALLLALLLHSIIAWWFLTHPAIQPVAEPVGSSGVVISLASQRFKAAGTQPAGKGSTEKAEPIPTEKSAPELPTPAEAPEDSPPIVNEAVAQPSEVEDSIVPEVVPPAMPVETPVATPELVPEPIPATLPTEPSEPPIAQTYEIPADELREMQAAERRRQQAAENRKRLQEQRQQEAIQRRRDAEIARQRAVARQQAAERNEPPPAKITQESRAAAIEPREALIATAPFGAESGTADATTDSIGSATLNSGAASLSTTASSSRGNSAIPDCRDDSDIGGNSNKAAYKTTLRRYLLARQKYPRRAAQRRQQGCVVAQVSINQQGQVTAASLIRKSGYRLLDSAALKLIKPGKKLPTPPAELANLSFKIPFDYRLN